jgi:hypothetical protein
MKIIVAPNLSFSAPFIFYLLEVRTHTCVIVAGVVTCLLPPESGHSRFFIPYVMSIKNLLVKCELPRPARPDGLAEGGASCFYDALCRYRCIHRSAVSTGVDESRGDSFAHQKSEISGDISSECPTSSCSTG